VLAGEQQFEEIVLNDLDWYAENGIRLMLKRKVVKIDRARRRVIAETAARPNMTASLSPPAPIRSSCPFPVTTFRE